MFTEPEKFSALVIDDDPVAIELLADALEPVGVTVHGAPDASQGLALFQSLRPNLVITDLVLPDRSGMELLDEILQIDMTAAVMLVTGHYSTETALQAIQKGACDYIAKPIVLDVLRGKVRAAVDEFVRRQERERPGAGTEAFEGMLGRSVVLAQTFTRIRRIGPHFDTALITGDTGTGKELAARALHRHSRFASGPLVVCNCAALVDTLFESELFGYVKGAFTGAAQDKLGLAEAAANGTLVLDEVGELPLSLQAKLLRFLQNREVQRVGSTAVKRIDVQVVGVTHRDLRARVKEGAFREDLYYRLAPVEIKMPKLAERSEDLPMLIAHFLRQSSVRCDRPELSLTRRAQNALERYSWPGNIRELENVLTCAAMMAETQMVDIADFPGWFQESLSRGSRAADNELLPLDELNARHARRVLGAVRGNHVRAAEVLGISRGTLYRLLGSRSSVTGQTSPQ